MTCRRKDRINVPLRDGMFGVGLVKSRAGSDALGEARPTLGRLPALAVRMLVRFQQPADSKGGRND